jgi:hypothetical protein
MACEKSFATSKGIKPLQVHRYYSLWEPGFLSAIDAIKGQVRAGIGGRRSFWRVRVRSAAWPLDGWSAASSRRTVSLGSWWSANLEVVVKRGRSCG